MQFLLFELLGGYSVVDEARLLVEVHSVEPRVLQGFLQCDTLF